ncbi:hypothetical protein AJ80_00518 [Polytolypa hystricis UAMH7299]|uniref:Alpha/beta hydrolase fold-3 domain-containing protein n=1 Tax=Polytolypa hystricis (strain UAMH7299) TaxID=1447883 RepID=A0A2B7Z2Z4_POLH7|nr:hypothetical protein AJ80_00518 [Polytolypa hystricis UAMH7299]
MPFNTITVGAAVMPTMLSTFLSHFINRKKQHGKPTRHISYHEGLHLIRRFLYYASHHTVEDIQTFTAQWVPSPSWVRVVDVTIPTQHLTSAANLLMVQLGRDGVTEVGGSKWWQWRANLPYRAQWIEMKSDYHERKKSGAPVNRVMLYVHGGAYFFGSVDTHRYQMQRHARKLKARIFARVDSRDSVYHRDCIAAYLYVLTLHKPSEIILAGDSAGAGMVLSVLVTLRDQKLPLPAGAILISPWADLTHSFPSLGGDGQDDYIPRHGFMQRPSMAWPPPSADELSAIIEGARKRQQSGQPTDIHAMPQSAQDTEAAIQGFSVHLATDRPRQRVGLDNLDSRFPNLKHNPSVEIDGVVVEIKDQIQMYTTNHLLAHPLVSPVFQPSLGGLPPILVLTGGGEILRDEQIYLAHKAADPPAYPPSDESLDTYDPTRELLTKYKPTYVQLQVWDHLCHVAPTLSFTRPAKHMYRSVAQFAAWALARAQQSSIDIPDGGDVSSISSNSSTSLANSTAHKPTALDNIIGKAGDPLPPFQQHMIRQRVAKNGVLHPLPHKSSLPALQLRPSEVGMVKPGPVRKWMAAKEVWGNKYAKDALRVRKQRIKELLLALEDLEPGELPPPSSLVARKNAYLLESKKKHKKNHAISLWSKFASKHDVKTLEKEEMEAASGKTTTTTTQPSTPRGLLGLSEMGRRSSQRSRGRDISSDNSARARSVSRTRPVMDEGQANESHEALVQQRLDDQLRAHITPTPNTHLTAGGVPLINITSPTEPQFHSKLSRSLENVIGGTEPSPHPSGNTEDASITTIMNAEGIIRAISDVETESQDYRTPDEFPDALSRADTGSVYSRDEEERTPRMGSLGDVMNASATGPMTTTTTAAEGAGRGLRRYDFDSMNLDPSDTEPFPAFQFGGSESHSVASRAMGSSAVASYKGKGREY